MALPEQLAGGAEASPLVNGHCVNSSDPNAAFAWHVDNHDEAEGGEYIAHSLRFAFALRANRRSSSPGLYLSALYALRAQVWSQPARI